MGDGEVVNTTRLCEALPGWTPQPPADRVLVGVLVGEGVGEEVIPCALNMLRAACADGAPQLEIRFGGLIGKPALLEHGRALTGEVVDFCRSVFADGGALLCGPGGGRFVYELRAEFDLYCKYTPIKPMTVLQDCGVVRPEHLHDIDILAVRENTSGLYFGASHRDSSADEDTVVHEFRYRRAEVTRILRCAFQVASQRRGKVSITTKPGGLPVMSALWEELAYEFASELGIELTVLEIDNAIYQMIARPQAFDVIVSPNMFGDVLADSGALLLGSRGMSYSGNFGDDHRAVYQTGHGAAHDIAGHDLANPIGQMLSVAMMLRESFGLSRHAARVEAVIENTLARGFRTRDITSAHSTLVGTRALGELVTEGVLAAARETV
jgi:3-isopropylmalate dehydrogenase